MAGEKIKILLNLSKINNMPEKPYCYMAENNPELVYEGFQTNEAPVKRLIHKAKCDGSEVTEIICVVTSEAEKKGLSEFREGIQNFCAGNDENPKGEKTEIRMPEIKIIKDDGKPDNHVILDEIFKEIVKETDSNKDAQNTHVYIDYTGGKRHNINLLTVTIRMMKVKGIHCDCVVYAELNPNQILDVTETFRLFDLLNGVHDFTNYGNADAICNYLSESNKEKKDKIIESFCTNLKTFSDDIKLCRLDNLIVSLKNINDDLTNIDNSKSSSLQIILLKQLTQTIRDELNLNNESSINYINLIRWCTKNDMIQLAVSIVIEKIPEVIIKNVFTMTDDFEKYFLKTNSKITSPYNRIIIDHLCNPNCQNNTSIDMKYDIDIIKKAIRASIDAYNKNCKDTNNANKSISISNRLDGNNSVIINAISSCVCSINDSHTNKKTSNIFYKDLCEIRPEYNEKSAEDFLLSLLAKKDKNFVLGFIADEAIIKNFYGSFVKKTSDSNTKESPDITETEKRLRAVNVLRKNVKTEYAGLKYKKSEDIVINTQEILADVLFNYLTIKEFRNRICHISDNTEIDEEFLRIFNKKNYSEITITDYQNILNKTCDLLDSLTQEEK